MEAAFASRTATVIPRLDGMRQGSVSLGARYVLHIAVPNLVLCMCRHCGVLLKELYIMLQNFSPFRLESTFRRNGERRRSIWAHTPPYMILRCSVSLLCGASREIAVIVPLMKPIIGGNFDTSRNRH